MGRVWPYYSAWRDETFTCPHCGWAGKVSWENMADDSNVATRMECPQCYRSLGVVIEFPNLKATEEAATRGNSEAIAALPGFSQRVNHNGKLLERFEREKVTSADELPELQGESLEFIWDFRKESDGEYYQIVKIGEKELWLELAFWNNIRRFEEVKGLLKQKYGARFRSLTPTDDSLEWLTGNKVGNVMRLSTT